MAYFPETSHTKSVLNRIIQLFGCEVCVLQMLITSLFTCLVTKPLTYFFSLYAPSLLNTISFIFERRKSTFIFVLFCFIISFSCSSCQYIHKFLPAFVSMQTPVLLLNFSKSFATHLPSVNQ